MKYRRRDNGKTIEVFQSFDGRWMAGWKSDSGGWYRVKSKALEPAENRDKAQRRLDAYAADQGWQPLDWIHELAEQIAADLFTDSVGEVARRLVIELDDGRQPGGYCEQAVSDRIETMLRKELARRLAAP